MGAVAHAAMDVGGVVTGIIPDFLVVREHALQGARDLIVVKDMHERKRLLFENADAFVALPGGIGTLEEVVEQLSWIQLQRHKKPVLLVNLKGFWNPFMALIEHLIDRGFIHNNLLHFLVAERIEHVLPMLRTAVRDLSDMELRGPATKAVAEDMSQPFAIFRVGRRTPVSQAEDRSWLLQRISQGIPVVTSITCRMT